MGTQNSRDFLKAAVFIDESTASLPIASIKVDEKSKLSEDRISVFVGTAKLNNCSFYKFICLFQIPAICGMESKEYSIVLILILQFIKR